MTLPSLDQHDTYVISTQNRQCFRRLLGHWSGPEVEAATSMIDAVHAEALAKFEGIDLVSFTVKFWPMHPESKAPCKWVMALPWSSI